MYRKAEQGTNLVRVNTPNILNINNYNMFWVSWSGGVISVGTGSSVGANTFMLYADQTPSPVNYLAFSAWNTPGTAIAYSSKYIELQKPS